MSRWAIRGHKRRVGSWIVREVMTRSGRRARTAADLIVERHLYDTSGAHNAG